MIKKESHIKKEIFMVSVNIYSNNSNEIEKFLTSFYNTSIDIENEQKWEHIYENPIEIVDIIGAFIDNYEDFNIRMLISVDKDLYINITRQNAENILKYLFERFPY